MSMAMAMAEILIMLFFFGEDLDNVVGSILGNKKKNQISSWATSLHIHSFINANYGWNCVSISMNLNPSKQGNY